MLCVSVFSSLKNTTTLLKSQGIQYNVLLTATRQSKKVRVFLADKYEYHKVDSFDVPMRVLFNKIKDEIDSNMPDHGLKLYFQGKHLDQMDKSLGEVFEKKKLVISKHG